MAFKLHKSTRDPVRLPLASDPAVAAANDKAALAHYTETLDYSALTIPADATWVTLRPLNAKERVEAVEAVRVAGAGEGSLINIMAYAESAFPRAVIEVEVEGEKMSALDLIDAIGGDGDLLSAIAEIMGAISKISRLDNAGKARSGPRAG